MKFIRLDKDSFIRQYDSIGYIYNQSTKKDLIVDNIGAVFLSFIGRTPVLISKIVDDLCNNFSEVSKQELNNDFREFLESLRLDGFIVVGDNELELDKNEAAIPVRDKEVIIKKTEDSKNYLNKHFQEYPKIFRAHIELTNSCNLKCIHCYLSPEAKKCELTKEQLFSFLNQLESMGTLEIIITGGEILLYKDLISVLNYATKKDFSIVLLTNGTLFNDEIIDALRKINISFVQVSLYSMNPKIHDKITGIPGSWDKTIINIKKLFENDIRIEIACPIIKENKDSFHDVLQYYNSIGINVSNDLGIMAGDDFSRDNLDHRVSKLEIKGIVERKSQFELSHKSLSSLQRNCSPLDSVCSMGKSVICLSYDGNYYPCPGFRLSLGSICDESLFKIWESSAKINFLRNITYSSFSKCLNCDYVEYCSICPAKFYNGSGGDIFKIDEYFCELTKAEVSICMP